jgi:hypothetical protein
MPAVIMLTRLAPAAVTLPPAIVSTEDFRLAGFIRRAGNLGETLPAMFENGPVKTGIEELASVVPAGGLDRRGLEGRGADRRADRGALLERVRSTPQRASPRSAAQSGV